MRPGQTLSDIPGADRFSRVLIALAHPARAQYGLGVVAASILIKNSLAILPMLVLAGVTSFHAFWRHMRKLGLPWCWWNASIHGGGIDTSFPKSSARMTTCPAGPHVPSCAACSRLTMAGGLIGLLFLCLRTG